MKYPRSARFIAVIVVVPPLMAAALIAYDVYLTSTGQPTISWETAQWIAEEPIIAFGLGLLVMAWFLTGVALGFHFMWGMPKPREWADYMAAKETAALVPAFRIQVAGLLVDSDILRTEKRLAEAQCAEYRRRTTELEFQVSDLLAGRRDEHGYPPELRIYPGPPET